MLSPYEQLKVWAREDDMRGFDCLGAEGPVYGPSMSSGTVYTDKATITAVQKALAARGYFNGVVDGKFGPVTEAAIFNFSGQHGPPDDALLAKLGLVKSISFDEGSTISVGPKSAPSSPSSSSSKSTALVPAAPGAAPPSWWTQPAWQGGMARWKVAAIGGGGAVGLVAILALLVGGPKAVK